MEHTSYRMICCELRELFGCLMVSVIWELDIAGIPWWLHFHWAGGYCTTRFDVSSFCSLLGWTDVKSQL